MEEIETGNTTYNQEIMQGLGRIESENIVPKLSFLCIRSIEKNLDKIPNDFRLLPSSILKDLVDYLMSRRKLGSRVLNENNVNRFFVPNLQELDLESFWLTDAPFQNYNSPYLLSLNITNCLSVTDVSLEIILSKSVHLRELKAIGCKKITNRTLENLSKYSSHLTVLELSCDKLSDEGFEILLKGNLKNLVHVGLDRTKLLTFKTLQILGKISPNLITLHWSNSLIFDDSIFQSIESEHIFTSSLVSLNISDCPKLIAPNLKIFSHLVNLEMRDCNGLQETSFLNGCSNLQNLKLIRCERIVDISGIGLVSSNLVSLILDGSKRIKQSPIFQTFSSQLQVLSLSFCRAVTSLEMNLAPSLLNLDVSYTAISIPNVIGPQLTSLNVSGTSIQDHHIQLLVARCLNLKELNISICSNLKDSAISFLSTLSQLTNLNLSKCSKFRRITLSSNVLQYLDMGYTNIRFVTFNCPNLTTLDISACRYLKNALDIIENCAFHLKNLWILAIEQNVVPELPKTLLSIAPKCRNLQILNLSGNKNLTYENIESFSKNCHNISRVYLNDTNIHVNEIASLRIFHSIISTNKQNK